jgi:hypothetical protein
MRSYPYELLTRVILSEAKRSRRITRRRLKGNAMGFLDFVRNDEPST